MNSGAPKQFRSRDIVARVASMQGEPETRLFPWMHIPPVSAGNFLRPQHFSRL